MKTAEELIHETVEGLKIQNKNVDKRKLEEGFKKVIIDGVPVHQAFNVPQDVLEQVYAYAYRLYNSGNYRDASVLFSFLVTVNPSDPKYYLGAAATFHRQRNYEDAVECYMACYCLNPFNPIPFYHLYDCWKNLNDYDSCLFALTMAIELSGDNPNYKQIKERSKMSLEGLLREIEQLRLAWDAEHAKD